MVKLNHSQANEFLFSCLVSSNHDLIGSRLLDGRRWLIYEIHDLGNLTMKRRQRLLGFASQISSFIMTYCLEPSTRLMTFFGIQLKSISNHLLL